MSRIIIGIVFVALVIGACKNKTTAFRTESENIEHPESNNTLSDQKRDANATGQAASQQQVASQTRPLAAKDAEGNPQIGSAPPKNRDSKLAKNRAVFFKDYVGGTDEAVYEAVKGQRYLTSTRLFIFATDEHMEGTGDYTRVEETMKSTNLDDRIFIWVHLDKDHNVKFVQKLISENVKDQLEEANYVL